MKSQKTRKTMKGIAASLLVLCLIFTMMGTGTFASYAYADGGNDDGTTPPREVVPGEGTGGNTGTYELTYNVEHYGKGETVVYRLVKD